MLIMRLAIALLAILVSGCAAPPPAPVAPVEVQPLRSEAAYREQRQQAMAGAVRVNEHTGQKEFVGQTEFVILSDFEFSPAQLHFRSGTLVRVRLSNVALVTHYFGGEEFFRLGAEPVNLLGSFVPRGQHHIPVAPLSERDLFLFIKDPGDYLLDCFVPNHRVAGMVGRLIVEP